MVRKVAIVGSEGKFITPLMRDKIVQGIKEAFFIEADKIKLHWAVPWTDMIEYVSDRIILISGGCGYNSPSHQPNQTPGVDEYAEIVADVLGIKKEIHYAPAAQWYDIINWESTRYGGMNVPDPKINLKGYKTRNIEIAKDCDVLYCFDPKWRGSKTGGQWTMRYAEKLGKEVHLVQLE